MERRRRAGRRSGKLTAGGRSCSDAADRVVGATPWARDRREHLRPVARRGASGTRPRRDDSRIRRPERERPERERPRSAPDARRGVAGRTAAPDVPPRKPLLEGAPAARRRAGPPPAEFRTRAGRSGTWAAPAGGARVPADRGRDPCPEPGQRGSGPPALRKTASGRGGGSGTGPVRGSGATSAPRPRRDLGPRFRTAHGGLRREPHPPETAARSAGSGGHRSRMVAFGRGT